MVLEMTYLGQENSFVTPYYSLTKFEVYFRHLLGALTACNAFLKFFVAFCFPKIL